MKILLVSVHPAPSPQSVPLAAAFLQSFCHTAFPDSNNITIEALDYALPREIAATVADITARNADLVAFSLYIWNRQHCLEIARQLRADQSPVIVTAGGPEATADTETLLQTKAFDFLICGEGEQPFASLCHALTHAHDVRNIPGIATLDLQARVSLTPATPCADLDRIPSPWLTGILKPSDYSGILWQLARGCSFACDFCFDSRDRHGVRRFSLERLEAELRFFAASNVSQIFVLDSTFNQDLPRAKTILRLIRKIAPQIHFHFEVRSEFIDRELAELFSRITCSLQIGLQSTDATVLKQVGRNFRQDDFARRIQYLNQNGATFGFDLIYGLPGDTLAGFCHSLDSALSLYPNHLDIFPLAILPGTALAARASSIGIHWCSNPPYTVTDTLTMNCDDFATARSLANSCDIFYTRGKAVAWFNAMLAPLGLTASQFLSRFGTWLPTELGQQVDEGSLDDETVWQLQRRFLTTLFTKARLAKLLPTLLDLVDYHYHYAAALLSPVPKNHRRITRNAILHHRFHRAEAARLASFNHEILELLDAGAVDIRQFASRFKRSHSWAVIYPTAGGVATESLAEPFFRLLAALDGTNTVTNISTQIGLSADDAIAFMEFACAEGIAFPVQKTTKDNG